MPVDRRADVWAFGVVLVEMLTGKRLFVGDTISHVLASVLKDEPNLDLLPAATPAAVRRLLRACVQKKSRRRLQAIGDARVVLEDVLEGREKDEPASPVTGPRRSKLLTGVGAMMGVALAVALAASWSPGSRSPAPASTRPPATSSRASARAASTGCSTPTRRSAT